MQIEFVRSIRNARSNGWPFRKRETLQVGSSNTLRTHPSKSTWFEILCVAVPKVLGGISQLALSLVLIRFLGPAQFGILSVCLTSILLLDAVLGSAIDMAIFRLAPLYATNDVQLARQVEKAGLYLKPVGSLVLLVPLVLFAPFLSQALFQDPNQGTVLLASYAALVGLLMFRSMQVHFQIERRFVAYGVTDLVHTFTRFGLICLLLVAFGPVFPEHILGIYFLAATGVTVAGLLTASRAVLAVPYSRNATRELVGVLRWYLPAVIAGSFVSRMDMFFVSAWGGVAEAGIYGTAQMFALLPQLLGTYAAAVLSPRILPMWREGKLVKVYGRYQLLLSGAAIGLFLVAWLSAGPLGDWILPEAYQRASTVSLLLLPTGLVAFINFPVTIPLLLYTHPKVLLIADLLTIPIAAAAYVLAVPRNGAAVAATITSMCALLRLALYQILAYSLLRRDPDGSQWASSTKGTVPAA